MTLASGIVFGNCNVSGCAGQFRPDSDDSAAAVSTQEWVTASSNVTTALGPALARPFDLSEPDYRPGSPAIDGRVVPALPDPTDPFFVPAPFIGAVGGAGSGQDLWWQGWTDFAVR